MRLAKRIAAIALIVAPKAQADTLTITTTPASDGRVADVSAPLGQPNGTGDQVLQGENTPQPQRLILSPLTINLRLLLEIDITSLPPFAVVNSATLRLRFTQVNNPTLLAHLTTSEEGEVTADDYQAVSTTTVPSFVGMVGLNDFTVTSDVEADRAAGRPYSAFRLQLVTESGGNSSGPLVEASELNEGNPPRLIIDFTLPPVSFVLTDVPVSVPEGGTASFGVALSASPTVPIQVAVTPLSGDADLTIQAGAMLTFDSNNNNVPQSVTIAAAQDPDFLNGSAVFRISGGDIPIVDVTAVEDDDEPAPARLYVHPTAAGSGMGDTWADAFTDLQPALGAAMQTGGAVSEIWVAAGTYRPAPAGGDREASFVLPDGVTISGGFGGGETSLSEQDPVAHTTILSGDLAANDGPNFAGYEENSYHVVHFSAGNAGLDGLVISGGNANGVPPADRGGGVFKTGGTLTLQDCTLAGNLAGRGGGIFNDGALVATGCEFHSNAASTYGGAVYDDFTSNVTLDGCTFRGNAVNGPDLLQRGGAVYNAKNTTGSILNCLFVGNQATIVLHSGGSSYGGGMFNEDCAPSVINCRFIGNYAHDDGGGLMNFSFTQPSSPAVINCTFAWNAVVGSGGGLRSFGLCPLFPNCSFLIPNNTSVVHGVFWGNRDHSGETPSAQFRSDFGSPSVSYSCLQGGWSGAGVGNIDVDPHLTPDGHLLADSPCIDAGRPGHVSPIGIDCDGDRRISGPGIDMGADEFVDGDGDRLPDWWETRYGGDPAADADGDGLPALQEYEWLASNPTAPPVFVDGSIGDDGWDGSSPAPAGGGVGPKRTVLGGLLAADNGDTLVLAPGVYSGAGNTNLLLGEVSVVIRGAAGAAATFVDGGGADRVATFLVGSSPAVVLDSLTIRNGLLGAGGTILHQDSSFGQLKDCVVEGPPAAQAGDGFRCPQAHALIRGSSFDGAGDGMDTHRFSRAALEIEDELLLLDEETTLEATQVLGSGAIRLGSGGTLSVGPGLYDSSVRCAITSGGPAGAGHVRIDGGALLNLEGNGLIDLGGPDGGDLTIYGTLVARDNAVVQNSNVFVVLLGLENGTGIFNNSITLLDSTGFGGEFFVEGNASILNNIIVAEGDRYLDFDPDPAASSGITLAGNQLFVHILEGAAGEQGTLFELRGLDYDCGGLVNPACGSGAFVSADADGFTSDNWVLEQLVIFPDSKVNLTNRPGFAFQPQAASPETVYVEQIRMHPGAVLNTGLQALYYQTIVDEGGAALDPNNLTDGRQIVDVPVLGFSLVAIEMNDQIEFDVRVRTHVKDDPEADSDDPTTAKGLVKRVENAGDGYMDMRTQAPGHPAATLVAAKGAFARAAEDMLVISFAYRFVANPAAELIVFLSDDPDVRDALVEVAHVLPPAPGRAGSIGSSEFATFYGVFPRGSLNFTRGTYVELELRSAGTGIPSGSTQVHIDHWDPQIECLACADLNGNAGVESADFLILAGTLGLDTTSPPAGQQNVFCLDGGLSGDKYVDIFDILAWDTVLNNTDALNACGLNLATSGPSASGTELPTDALVISGKSNVAAQQDDALYPIGETGLLVGAVQPPASAAGPDGQQRGNGRLIRDGTGGLFQIHAAQGLIRLSDASVVVTPGEQTFAGNTVHVGVIPLNDGLGGFAGRPITDAVFDPADPSCVYVVPAVVTPVGRGACESFRAAARLGLTGGGNYTIEQLYTPPAGSSVVGCGAIPEPDLTQLREIELSPDGARLFVASAQAFNDNDWLLVFDASSSTLQQQLALSSIVPQSMPLTAPQAMTVGQTGGTSYLYLTSGVPDLPDGRTRVYRLDASGVGAPQFAGVIDIAQPVCADGGLGCNAAVTSIAIDTASDSLWVAGYTSPRLAVDHPYGAPPFIVDGMPGPIFTTPTMASIAPDEAWSMSPPAAPTVEAIALAAGNLALPISIIVNGESVGCAASGDADGDDDRDLRDVAALQACFTGSGSFSVSGVCAPFNADCDSDVDLTDHAAQLPLTGP